MHTKQTWTNSGRPLPGNGRAEMDFYNGHGYDRLIAFFKNPVVVTFAILYHASVAAVSILSTYLVCSICFTEKAWEICVWIVLNIYIFIELTYCLGWSAKAFKKSMLLDVFISAKINILLFLWLTVSFVVVPDEKQSILIREKYSYVPSSSLASIKEEHLHINSRTEQLHSLESTIHCNSEPLKAGKKKNKGKKKRAGINLKVDGDTDFAILLYFQKEYPSF